MIESLFQQRIARGSKEAPREVEGRHKGRGKEINGIQQTVEMDVPSFIYSEKKWKEKPVKS